MSRPKEYGVFGASSRPSHFVEERNPKLSPEDEAKCDALEQMLKDNTPFPAAHSAAARDEKLLEKLKQVDVFTLTPAQFDAYSRALSSGDPSWSDRHILQELVK